MAGDFLARRIAFRTIPSTNRTARMDYFEIMNELKRIAPSVAFTVDLSFDPYFQWSGDGPDPTEDGYEACTIEVSACTIVRGINCRGQVNLGGQYVHDTRHDPDISGHLPQLLVAAAEDLLKYKSVAESPTHEELHAAIAFIDREIAARCAASHA